MNTTGKDKSQIICGRNAVKEAIISGRDIEYIIISNGNHSGGMLSIIKKAKENKILIKEADVRKLDRLSGGIAHQGVLAVASSACYVHVQDIINMAESKGELPFIVIAEKIEDPHNLGAIIRTAECAGAHGVIIPKRRSVGLTAAVGKISAGALEYMPVARVNNIASLIDDLKKQGIFVYGADMDGENWCETNLKGAVALVIGNEGFGLSRLVREKCDAIISLPLCGNINSLNASVAAGILMYEITRQRLGINAK